MDIIETGALIAIGIGALYVLLNFDTVTKWWVITRKRNTK